MLLLASDLDGTLLGDDSALARFSAAVGAVRSSMTLVYVTGRSYVLCPSLLAAPVPLPEPDFWITSIGTEIYEGGRPDPEWQAQMEQAWNRERLEAIAATFPEIRPHPDPLLQTPCRIIYHLDPQNERRVTERFQAMAEAEGIRAQFIFSHGIELDIVPWAGNKGKALTFLAARLGIDRARTIACGDSGNDANLLEAAGRGIVVANAQPELLAWRRANPGACFLASRERADGVLEGLAEFGVLGR